MSRKAVIKNIIWLTMEKLLRLSFGIYVVSYIARGLGPENFGIINLATAILAIVTSVSLLGLKTIVIKEILESENHKQDDIIYTAFSLLIISSIISFVLVIVSSLFVSSNILSDVLIIMSFMILFRPFDVFKDFYDSQVNSKVYSQIDAFVFIFISIIKILCIYFNYGVYTIACLTVLELILSSLLLFSYFKKNNNLGNFISFSYAKRLLYRSWPLILSSLAWIVYTKIDQLMIAKLMTMEDVGIYSVGTKFTDILYFVPSFIVISSVPLIYSKFKNNDIDYIKYYQVLYDAVTFLSICIALFFNFFSKDIIENIFGTDYVEAIPILKINIFSLIFVGMALVSGQYLIYKGKEKIVMMRHFFGILSNFILNYLLIPKYGIEGAATATLISLFCANYLFDLTSKETFSCFIHKTKSFFFINLITEIISNKRFLSGKLK